MAEKKYFWIKLKSDFFSKKEIKKLRKLAGGDTYTIIFLKLQLLSLGNNGTIYFDGVENTLEEEIALEIDEDVENVKVTIAYMLKLGWMEEIRLNNSYFYSLIEISFGAESASASRVRKYREKEKTLHCNAGVTECNKKVTTEQEQEQEQETDLNNRTTTKNIGAHAYITDGGFCQDVNSVDNSQNYDDDVVVLCEKCNLKLNDMDKHLEKYGEDYVKSKLLLLSIQKNVVENKGAWLRSALENDYHLKQKKQIAKADVNCKKCHGTGYITFVENLTNETLKMKCDYCIAGR